MDKICSIALPSLGWVGVLIMGVALVGCGKGGPERPRLYGVNGELFVKGQPASGARVILHPVENADPSGWPTGYPRAIVDTEGKFAIGTFDDKDGAPVGKYKVLANWLTGGSGNEEDPDAPQPVNQIDVKYNDPTTTPWEFEVKPEKNKLPRLLVP